MSTFNEFSTWPHQLVSFPFPLDDGGMANLDLPARGLTRGEADRLKRYVDTLVIEEPDAERRP